MDDMRVRIGTTIDGRTVSIDFAAPSTTVVLGDPGTGKTTLARHLVRWWLARTGDAQVFTSRPAEWADLTTVAPRLVVTRSLVADVRARGMSTLRVLDGLNDVDEQIVTGLSGGCSTTLIAAESAWANRTWSDRAAVPVTSWGFIARPDSIAAGEDGALLAQGRLDWAPGTAALLRDLRGPLDFPRHRWSAVPDARSSSVSMAHAGAGVELP